jgi:hypothetical protein
LRERVAARNELRVWLEERNVPLDQVKIFKKVLEHEKVMREPGLHLDEAAISGS